MGIGAFLNGIGHLLGKIPLQNRVERLKNELESLQQERALIILEKCDVKKAKRLTAINKRIAKLQQLLKNNASD